MKRKAWPIIVTVSLLFITLNSNGAALSTDKACELCQTVLTHTYYTYLQQSTRKLVLHRIKHNCNRYANYRRRCILTILPKARLVFDNMKSSPIGEYRAFKSCVLLKECSEHLEKNSVADSMPESIIDALLNGTISANSTLVEGNSNPDGNYNATRF